MASSKGKEPSSNDQPSPSASFYDLSDDEEGGYNTIAHARTRKGVKLLFSKSKVSCSAAPQKSRGSEIAENSGQHELYRFTYTRLLQSKITYPAS
jgi:hypothetical protein